MQRLTVEETIKLQQEGVIELPNHQQIQSIEHTIQQHSQDQGHAHVCVCDKSSNMEDLVSQYNNMQCPCCRQKFLLNNFLTSGLGPKSKSL
jgi:hypothetical protein